MMYIRKDILSVRTHSFITGMSISNDMEHIKGTIYWGGPPSEGMSNNDAKINNVEVQIIPLYILYQKVGKSDWNPNIGKFM